MEQLFSIIRVDSIAAILNVSETREIHLTLIRIIEKRLSQRISRGYQYSRSKLLSPQAKVPL